MAHSHGGHQSPVLCQIHFGRTGRPLVEERFGRADIFDRAGNRVDVGEEVQVVLVEEAGEGVGAEGTLLHHVNGIRLQWGPRICPIAQQKTVFAAAVLVDTGRL